MAVTRIAPGQWMLVPLLRQDELPLDGNECVLPYDPITLLVFRNGVLQAEGGDYTRTGRRITFVPEAGILAGERITAIGYDVYALGQQPGPPANH